jgi:hypothetical protein
LSSSEPSSNRGYAFVNFTTADAARGFHYALHGCGWKPWVAGRSHKSVNIAAAHIQVSSALDINSYVISTTTLNSIVR